jgi:23S rRNA (adenine2503-C2)-methyltransferase
MKPHLFGMRPEELVEALARLGVTCTITEARRVQGHVLSDAKDDLDLRKPPRREVLRAIDEQLSRAPLEIVERSRDEFDGFVKYLFRHPDGALTEAVRIPLEKAHRFTVCLSSQVGCAMRCAFCATGELGLTRSLAAWEMVAAFRAIKAEAVAEDARRHVSGAVFMGQGEPFHNYDEVIQAARVLSDPCGGRIAKEAITISTVGLVPQIERYAREAHPYRLIVSVTSAVEERRRELLPVAGRFSMDELAAALGKVAESTGGKRVTLAWVLMQGVNHGEDEVEALKTRFAGVPFRVNLIDVNRADGRFTRATDDERTQMVELLRGAGIPTIRRYSGGKNKHAACGMLARTRHEQEADAHESEASA